MALAPFFCLAALLLSSAGCGDKSSASRTNNASAAEAEADSIPRVVPPADRELVLRARALDRADKLDSARTFYEAAAEKLEPISDWLYLRAAGVTTDASDRQKYYRELETDVGKTRKGPTEAIALERAGDIDGASRAYEAAGMKIDAVRLTAARPSDTARMAQARSQLIGYLASRPARDDARNGVALFDKLFPQASPSEQLTLARAAYHAGSTARTVAGYAAAFRAGLGNSEDHFADGMMLARLNRDADAAAQFARVTSPAPLVASARYQRARALLAMGRGSEARAALRAITTAFPADTTSASALLLLSDLASDELRDADARSTLKTIVQRFPRSRHAPTALFRAGLIAYVSRNYAAAAAELDSLSERYPQSDDAVAAMYWAGRAWEQRGDKAKAQAHWRAVMARDGASYYSVLSSRRLLVPLLRDSSRTDNYPRVRVVEEATHRIAMLQDVGMDTEAKLEFDQLFSDATKSPDRLVATARALRGGDQSQRGITLGRRAVSEIGPTPQNYRLMYPVVEREALDSSARANGLDPALVAGLIRAESSFNPRATSPVGARGLMQLMPDVGRALARSRGIPALDADRLYEPVMNIRLGTAHLAGLFRGNREVVQILAAYNAGESRVKRWVRKAGASDPELFTERIPYVETRDYVRGVVRNRAFYRALYDW
ncbi:MAG: transglycosylase SLT domain-containing protein [Gemmatimonadota bacterium]|nr:transglycosylase SLT domain-containing protein [Gemmatimonadota bacterium]